MIATNDLAAQAAGRPITQGIPPDPQTQATVADGPPQPPSEAPPLPNNFLDVPPDRMAWICEQAIRRIQECRTEMGVDLGSPIARTNSWAWIRQNARMMYRNNMEWRRLMGAVFEINNWSLNIPRWFIRVMAAQIADNLLGTDPFFAAMPDQVWPNPAKEALSKQVETKVQDEITVSNVREVLIESITVALTEGERCVKVTHIDDYTTFVGPAVVAIDPDGNPIKTPTTDEYIFPKDEFFPDPIVEGQMRLYKDPAYVANQPIPPEAFQRRDHLLQKIQHRKGVLAEGLLCEDFIYPIMLRSLDDADIMAHSYDEYLDKLEATYGQFDFAKKNKMDFSDAGPIGKDKKGANIPSPTGPLSGQSQPHLESGETDQPLDGVRRRVNIHETYYRVRVKPDDPEESWVFLVLDLRSHLPMYAEYLGNMKMKKPPFRMIRGLESEPGRPWGIGVYQAFQDKHLFIDLCFNRAALKSSKEGSVTFQHLDGTVETQDGGKIVIGDKKIYTIPAGSEMNQANPPIFRVNLNEISKEEMELLEKVVDSGMAEFGIGQPAGASNENLKGERTATGADNDEKNANILQGRTEDMIGGDIEKILEMVVDTVLENMDESAMQYSPDTQQLSTLNRDEIRTLDREIRLLLTAVRSAKALENNQAASQIVEMYYSKGASMRKKLRQFYINQLKALDIQDADDILDDPTPEELEAEKQQQSQPAPPTSSSEGISWKPGDLVGNERTQALARIGINEDQQALQQRQAEMAAMPQPAAPISFPASQK